MNTAAATPLIALAILCVAARAESPAKPPMAINEAGVRQHGGFVFSGKTLLPGAGGGG